MTNYTVTTVKNRKYADDDGKPYPFETIEMKTNNS